LLRRFTSFEEIGRERWDALVEHSEFGSVFQRYGWLASWWKAFKEPSWELILLGSTDGDRLVSLAPLYRVPANSSQGGETIRFVGNENSDYLSLIVDREAPELVDEYVREFLAFARQGARVVLNEIPEHTHLARQLLVEKDRLMSRVDVLKETVCPRLEMRDNTDSLAETLEKNASKQKRHFYKHLKRRDFVLHHYSDIADIAPLLDRYFQQHIERWSDTPYPSLFLMESNRTFYREFISSLCSTSQILFSVLQLDGLPRAFALGMISLGDLLYYKSTFDISLSQGSPGEVLLAELLNLALSDGYKGFDFTRGDEAYKKRFASEYRTNISFVIYPWITRKLAGRAYHMAKGALKKGFVRFGIRSSPDK